MLAAVLTAAQAQGREGKAVRALGEELGVPVRIRPPLPLGRAAAHPPALESHTSLEEDGAEVLAQRTEIHVTCGLGMNVYIAPDGACYPCYALHGRAFCLGNAIEQGLKEVIASERFQALRARTVDTTPHCRACPWRYLCGGYCRAWRQGASIDAPPGDCSALQKQAQAKLYAALEALGIPPERWEAACNDCRIFDHQTVRLSD
jgi:radical SAM protein with 4Fe4S-binding SPASM domain